MAAEVLCGMKIAEGHEDMKTWLLAIEPVQLPSAGPHCSVQ